MDFIQLLLVINYILAAIYLLRLLVGNIKLKSVFAVLIVLCTLCLPFGAFIYFIIEKSGASYG